ncbi:putative ribosomal protein L14 [Lyophyllum shimeji]|uniref:Ribosomal protein L14 n=1 Tax=Lyophyllum shimeji TaxID=47721 RepID=A0A9P3UQP3_LYOSH|nr:putative ribosomal protein L14 [Lyophyllum shimeji]
MARERTEWRAVLDGWEDFALDDPSNFKRFVEVGRVVLLKEGDYSGKIAIIAEILDQNRAIIDGPTSGVPRQPYSYKNMVLTPLKVTGLPRGARTGVVRKVAEKEAVVEKWNKTGWAQKRAAIEKRRSLNDFARFSVMLAKKQRRDAVRKTVRKLAQEQA